MLEQSYGVFLHAQGNDSFVGGRGYEDSLAVGGAVAARRCQDLLLQYESE